MTTQTTNRWKNAAGTAVYKLRLRARRSQKIASIAQIEEEIKLLDEEDLAGPDFSTLCAEILDAKARIPADAS